MPIDDVFLVEFLDLLGRDGGQWLCLYPLSQVVNGHNEELYLSFC